MRNDQTEKYTVAGLLVGGFTVIGTMLGAFIGFLISGGTNEFLNTGWIWTLNGSTLGSLLSAGIGLLGLAIHVRNRQEMEQHQRIEKHQSRRHLAAGLFLGGVIILGTVLGAFGGFLIGGGTSEFLNAGWIWKIGGLVLGSLLSTGIGLIGLAIHVKNIQNTSNSTNY